MFRTFVFAALVLVLATATFAQTDGYKPSADIKRMERELVAFPGWIKAQEWKVAKMSSEVDVQIMHIKTLAKTNPADLDGPLAILVADAVKCEQEEARLKELRWLYRKLPERIRILKEGDIAIWRADQTMDAAEKQLKESKSRRERGNTDE